MYFTYTKLININITTTITLSLFDREFGEAPKPTTSTHFHGNMTTSKAALARYLALCSTYPPPLLVLVCLCCTQAYGGLGRNLLLLCFIINNVAMLVVDMVIIGIILSYFIIIIVLILIVFCFIVSWKESNHVLNHLNFSFIWKVDLRNIWNFNYLHLMVKRPFPTQKEFHFPRFW